MIVQEQINLLDRLKSLLNEQIENALQGNSTGERIIALSEQAGGLVQQIVETGILEQPEMKGKRQQIQELYNCLYLSLSAQKAELEGNLNQIQKGKKIVKTYRNHI